ncbi:MAG TPA: SAM-dependent methyltransferase [Acidobacteriota bacterium]|nr:SAM-dependent methyltransferase [Acidobacteriota bacterium]
MKRLGASFRDPSGFLFVNHQGALYRQINPVYEGHYRLLMSSGLYSELASDGLLVEHEEVDAAVAPGRSASFVIRPRRLPFISYPYEWTFGQLKAAALLTLRIQRLALERGMWLKDASAYNIQFDGWRPILVDTLSFETYQEGKPWPAYRQFCEHFLAPLALMSCTGSAFHRFLRVHLDGIPLENASRLLPTRTLLRPGLATHLHLHSMAQKRFSDGGRQKSGGFSRNALCGLINSLESAVSKQNWRPKGTVWADYYDNTNYGREAFEHKRQLVGEFVSLVTPAPQLAWDFGANTGLYSRLLAERGILTISFDSDIACVEQNYLEAVKEKNRLVLPLVMDLANPSPALGWAHEERESLLQRGPADLLVALALVHHLAIGHNVPLERLAEFFASCARFLIVEFVPKSDSQVQRLLRGREDVFPDYTEENFIGEFGKHFTVLRVEEIKQSTRKLYLMKTKG